MIVQGNVATIRGELLTLATTPNRRPTSTSWHGYNTIMLNTNPLEYLLLITEMCITCLNSYLLHYKRTVITRYVDYNARTIMEIMFPLTTSLHNTVLLITVYLACYEYIWSCCQIIILQDKTDDVLFSSVYCLEKPI